MAHVSLSPMDRAKFSYRSNIAFHPAVSAKFSWDEEVKDKLQRRYPGARWDSSFRSWLIPKETVEDVTAFFAQNGYLVLRGKEILHDPRPPSARSPSA